MLPETHDDELPDILDDKEIDILGFVVAVIAGGTNNTAIDNRNFMKGNQDIIDTTQRQAWISHFVFMKWPTTYTRSFHLK